MRDKLVPVVLMGSMLFGCSHGESVPFQRTLSSTDEVQGTFEVTEETFYSVSLEAKVIGLTEQNHANRQRAWSYLSNDAATEALVAEVTLAPELDPDRRIVSVRVVNPKFSSWSDEVLYMELVRARLVKGTYLVRVSFSGRSLHQPSFVPGVVVQRTFSGK
ncbi:hypothetical protein [Dyella ginsengisoli]|uniref:hypothetical protein n=1 Tax=Dyella ginsengisoli TaxID=363848 RepID=UPI0012FE49F8|nr:hypothetical protein [Dyella ginsengisoli]